MSNNAFRYENELFKNKTLEILQSIINSSLASSEEQKLFLESLLEEAVADLTEYFEISELSIRDRVTYEQFATNINNLYLYCYVLSNLLKEISFQNEKLSAFEISKINQLQSKLDLLKQKISSINLFTGNVKYIVSESFNTSDYLEKSVNRLEIAKGLALLPIQSFEILKVKEYSIGANSVGTLGSSDPNAPSSPSLSEINEEKSLQWEELTGPYSLLELEIVFEKNQIVNGLCLQFLPVETISSCELLSIKSFENNTIVELIDETMSVDYNDSCIYFYPTYTNRLVVQLKQDYGYELTLTNNKTVNRKVISLSKCEPRLVTYLSEGVLESKKQSVKGNPNACLPELILKETNSSLYSIDGVYSVDGNKTFNSFTSIGSSAGIKDIYWKLLVKRNDEAFSNNSSVFDTLTAYEYATQIEYVSGLKSPRYITLNKKPITDQLTLIEPKVLRRGGDLFDLQLGVGTGSALKLKLPIELNPIIIRECTLRINGKIWEYVETLSTETATAEVWSLDKNNYEYIVFGDNVNGLAPADKATINFSLPFETLKFETVDEGYFAAVDYLFDPDLNNIDIFYVSESKSTGKVILQRNESVIKLPFRNIAASSVKLSEKDIDGTAYGSPIATTEVDFDGGDFVLASGEYTVDYKHGYIYFYEAIPSDDIVTVNFSYYLTKKLSKESIKIIYENSIPIGFLIAKDQLPTSTITDSIGSVLTKLTITGLESLAPLLTGTIDSKIFTLSRSSIIKNTLNMSNFFSSTTIPQEVNYIDGFTEFLNLIKVENEKTATFAGSGIVIQFSISNSSTFYEPLGISFEDSTYFAEEVTGVPAAPGEWSISSLGVVSVYVSAGLPSGITYSYYYSSSEAIDYVNKYSVDYDHGVIYTLSDLKFGASVTYKAGNFYAKYDISLLVEDYVFDSKSNTLAINTESNFTYSHLAKVIYPVTIIDNSISDLVKYYSPLIKAIIFRFS